jgi:glycosyltransferase involved in cell wall biosynthesis
MPARLAPRAPLVVSVHGGDVLYTAGRVRAGGETVRRTLAQARLVLANSAGIAELAREHGARETRVVHLGTDIPKAARPPVRGVAPTLVTVAHLVARKRHADVLRALAVLTPRHPTLRYAIVGDGPERERLGRLASSLGIAELVEFRGRLPHEQAVAVARSASLFVLPSLAEAFGVSYVEAMAAGVPALGCRAEDGPEEIAAAGGGIQLVEPRSPRALADAIDGLLADPDRLAALGAAARETVMRQFTWERCGRQTADAYRDVLDG